MSRRDSLLPSFDGALVRRAVVDSFAKLHPRRQLRNPVMLVVEVGAAFTTALWIAALAGHGETSPAFVLQIAAWLWFTVLFANFAEALAEGRGRAQADSLRKSRQEILARRLVDKSDPETAIHVAAASLEKGDLVVIEAGEFVPADGDIVEGIASIDESAITGESAPVIRAAGGDVSAVTGGTRVLSDRIVVRVTSERGRSFLDRMIAMVEGASRRKTPTEIALDVLLASLTIVFLVACATLLPYSTFAVQAAGRGAPISLTVVVALLVCLIPTTIGALLSAIGIAGMGRMAGANVVAMSGRAVEAAGDVDVLLLDKTGTITHGNRQAVELIPAAGVAPDRLSEAALLSSLADGTPEGKSVVQLAGKGRDVESARKRYAGATFVEFSAQSRMSGIDADGRRIRKGAPDAVESYVAAIGGRVGADVRGAVSKVARSGATPLLVCEGRDVLGVIHLKDVLKRGIRDRFADLRRMGIRTVMITGDNAETAAALAAESGVDDFLAEAKPEKKLALIRERQQAGHMVAMTGDGTNDAPALAQADVALAMNSGTQAAKEAANLVDLDSDPTKLIEVVTIGKQLLMTRGALTTFSLANDVAKYFAILPAAFASIYPGLDALNVMHLATPASAVLSAVIFNALIIIALIPLALKGVRFRASSAAALLRRHGLIYGVGGVVLPFVGIKAIDLLVTALGIA